MKERTLYLSNLYLDLAQQLVDLKKFRSKSDLIRSALIQQIESDLALNQSINLKLKITTVLIPEEIIAIVEDLKITSSFSEYTRLAMKNLIDNCIKSDQEISESMGFGSKTRSANISTLDNTEKQEFSDSQNQSKKVYATLPYPKMKITSIPFNGYKGGCHIEYSEG